LTCFRFAIFRATVYRIQNKANRTDIQLGLLVHIHNGSALPQYTDGDVAKITCNLLTSASVSAV